MAAVAGAPRLFAQSALERVFPVRFGRWNAVSSPIKIKTDDGRAQVFAESGLKNWLAEEYSDGTEKVGVTLRQFRDPSGAYEAYTSEFGPHMHPSTIGRSEEHTSELQSQSNLVCRLLLEKQNKRKMGSTCQIPRSPKRFLSPRESLS